MRPIVFLLCTLVFTADLNAQAFLGLFGSPNQPVDFGTEISEKEVSRFLTVLEEKSWKLKMDEGFSIAEKIPLNAKYTLYEKYKISGLWGFLNLYGVGSFFQGDPGTSLITLGGIAVFEAAVISSQTVLRNNPGRDIWLATGATVAGAAMVYGLVRPWFFADEQNRALKQMLFGKD